MVRNSKKKRRPTFNIPTPKPKGMPGLPTVNHDINGNRKNFVKLIFFSVINPSLIISSIQTVGSPTSLKKIGFGVGNLFTVKI